MRIVPSLVCVLVVGCGSSNDPPPDDITCPTSGRFFELAEGRSWTFRVTDTTNHTVEMKTQAVGALEAVAVHPGISAFKLTTTKPGGFTESWQEDTGSEIRRHAENDNSGTTTTTEHYDPFRIRIDETPDHILVGAAYTTSYTEVVSIDGGPETSTVKEESWSIVDDEEVVEVPAGTFCALHIHRTSTVGGTVGSTKDFFFTRGVGKVKEVGDGQTEELTSFTP